MSRWFLIYNFYYQYIGHVRIVYSNIGKYYQKNNKIFNNRQIIIKSKHMKKYRALLKQQGHQEDIAKKQIRLNNRYNIRYSLWLLLIILIYLPNTVTCFEKIYKLNLIQIQQQKYALNTIIGNSKVNLIAHLSDQLDWIKDNGCTVCSINQIKSHQSNGELESCQNSCVQSNQQPGITCSRSYCKYDKQAQQQQEILKQQLPYYIKQAKKAQLTLKIKHMTSLSQFNQKPKQIGKIKYTTLLVQKMNQHMPEVGRINLLNGRKGFFNHEVLIVKNHAKDISLYFYHDDQQQQKQQEELDKDRMTLVNSITKQREPLYGQIDIIKNDKEISNSIQSQIQNRLIIEGKGSRRPFDAKAKYTNKQKLKTTEEYEEEEEDQEQEQVNIFGMDQIMLKDKVNYVSVRSNLNREGKQGDSKQVQQNKNPYISVINLDRITAQFSIKTNRLLLPANIYKKLTKLIVQKYFSNFNQSQLQQYKQKNQDEQTQTQTEKNSNKNKCSFEMNMLTCPRKSQLKLQKLDNITLTLVLNNLHVEFPIRALIDSCSKTSCSFLIDISKDKKQAVIGDFIFNLFAMEYSKYYNRFTLYRLNNQWSTHFLSDKKYSQHQVNFMWMFLYFIFHAIWIVLKLIFMVAMIVLFLNCLYHWREMVSWLVQILAKLSNKNEFGETKSNIVNRMSIRIKDRIKGVVKRRPNQISALINSFQDQILTSQHTKILAPNRSLSINQLPDRGSHGQSSNSSQSQQNDQHQLKLNIRDDQFNIQQKLPINQGKKSYSLDINKQKQLITKDQANKYYSGNSLEFKNNYNKPKDKQTIVTSSTLQQRQEKKKAFEANFNQIKQSKNKEQVDDSSKSLNKQKQEQTFYQFESNQFQNQFPHF